MKEFLKEGVNVVMDSAWGSSGKGLWTAKLATIGHPDIVATNNAPNAGHTTHITGDQFISMSPNAHESKCFTKKSDNDIKVVLKCLPSSALVTSDDVPVCLMPDSVIKIEQFFEEIKLLKCPDRVKIHPRTCVLTNEDRIGAETTGRHLAGTMQGGGHAAANKMLRKEGVKLAKDYPELAPFIADTCAIIRKGVAHHYKVLFELPQGFDLSLNHGHEYPYLTNRDITAASALNSCGVSPHRIGNVFGIVRPYPIRVGNVEGGWSGPCWDDQQETTWEAVDKASGADKHGVTLKEITTVTGRVRRVFTFSEKQIIRYCEVNEPDYLIINFLCQIDYSLYGLDNIGKFSLEAAQKLNEFRDRLKEITGVPIIGLGTGPHIDQTILV